MVKEFIDVKLDASEVLSASCQETLFSRRFQGYFRFLLTLMTLLVQNIYLVDEEQYFNVFFMFNVAGLDVTDGIFVFGDG